jgi:transcriptional regulator with XRE-family HTH domain
VTACAVLRWTQSRPAQAGVPGQSRRRARGCAGHETAPASRSDRQLAVESQVSDATHNGRVASIERLIDRANQRADAAIRGAGREIRIARRDRNLSLDRAGAAAGISAAATSRIERGLAPEVSVLRLTQLAEVVGLELSLRLFAGGSPIRDDVHASLLGRCRDEMHPSLRWSIEVPLPNTGDDRAWDAMVSGPGWRYGVEAETAPRDVQALSRRLALKLRDGGVDGILLGLPRTRRVREFLAASRGMLDEAFPIPGTTALARLKDGLDPGGSSIILI